MYLAVVSVDQVAVHDVLCVDLVVPHSSRWTHDEQTLGARHPAEGHIELAMSEAAGTQIECAFADGLALRLVHCHRVGELKWVLPANHLDVAVWIDREFESNPGKSHDLLRAWASHKDDVSMDSHYDYFAAVHQAVVGVEVLMTMQSAPTLRRSTWLGTPLASAW